MKKSKGMKIKFELNGNHYYLENCEGIYYKLERPEYSYIGEGIMDLEYFIKHYMKNNVDFIKFISKNNHYEIDLVSFMKTHFNIQSKRKPKNTSGYGYVSGKFTNNECILEFNIIK